MIPSKLIFKSYLNLLFKSYIFKIGLAFIIVSLYFIFSKFQNYNFIREISLCINSKMATADVVGSEPYSYKTYSVNYIFKEDPDLYIYRAYFNDEIREGSTIKIIYCPFKPSYNRSISGSISPNQMYVLPLISLSFGIIMLFFNLKFLAQTHSILKNGSLTKAVLIQRKNTDYEEYFETYFEYFDHNKQRHVLEFETNNLDSITDEEEEFLIYNKTNPSKALLVDSLSSEMSDYIKKNWI